MEKRYRRAYFFAVFFAAILVASPAGAFTDRLDVIALRDLYKTLNQPQQLTGWKLDGGDPCDESWNGVSCFGSSVIYLKLNGLNLSGYITPEIYNLYCLKRLDISSNSIGGEIPNVLPPNAAHINMAYNHLIRNIPPSLPSMKSLRNLNLSHNWLSGTIGNVFTGLLNLKQMDLSYNNFTGDLPSSLGSLTNLNGLYLQHNFLNGTLKSISELQLISLNVESNLFTGKIPNKVSRTPYLWTGGNKFDLSESPPDEENLSPSPATQSSPKLGGNNPPHEENLPLPPATQPSPKLGGSRERTLGHGSVIAILVGGGTLVASCVAFYIAVLRIKRPSVHEFIPLRCTSSRRSFSVIHSAKDSPMRRRAKTPPVLTLRSPITLRRRLCPVDHSRVEKKRRKSFSDKSRFPVRIRIYTMSELHSATNSFDKEMFLGQDSLGSVYKAEFPDGQISIVKMIKMSGLSYLEEEKFLNLVWTLPLLNHPNIVPLLGYCVEHGQHLLVYEYARNFSLDEALHTDAYKPLSWGLRLQIALGVAQALENLHYTLSAPICHGNLNSANILLDEELAPRIRDYGLAFLRPLTSNGLRLTAFEDAINDTGRPGFDNTKSDIYAFGVLLFELLTGRKPSDREENLLVKWASLRLYDCESLKEMINPGIRKTCSSEALSDFADIISLCTQPMKEFRPTMSKVVEFLTQLIQKHNKAKGNGADGNEVDPSRDLSVQPTPGSWAHLG